MDENLEYLIVGGGCFWCLEAYFSEVSGVRSVVSGYCGGHTENPDYRTVCSGQSGHAEVVRLSFDPDQIDCRTLLTLFFELHDPTPLNRQGHDVGTQYRSVIFYSSEAQQKVAQALIFELTAQQAKGTPLVTELMPASRFFAAEEEHQNYFARHPEAAYCQVVIAPKLARFRARHAK